MICKCCIAWLFSLGYLTCVIKKIFVLRIYSVSQAVVIKRYLLIISVFVHINLLFKDLKPARQICCWKTVFDRVRVDFYMCLWFWLDDIFVGHLKNRVGFKLCYLLNRKLSWAVPSLLLLSNFSYPINLPLKLHQ